MKTRLFTLVASVFVAASFLVGLGGGTASAAFPDRANGVFVLTSPHSGYCFAPPITIAPVGPSTPYPSTCEVSGMSGSITDIVIEFNFLEHGRPDDLDMLLVSPGGQTATFLSDALGQTSPSWHCWIVFHDGNPVAPDNVVGNCPSSGNLAYGPANYEPSPTRRGDLFPPPAPAPSGNVDLSVFNGGSPKGTWSLYVVDDKAPFGGATPWNIYIVTTGP